MESTSFLIFPNDNVSLSKNFEKLVTHYLENLDFHFDIIGITETKIISIIRTQIKILLPKFQLTLLSTCPHHWPLEVLGSSLMKTLITQCLNRNRMKPFRHFGSKFLLANRRMSYAASYIANTILQIVLLNILVIQSKS